MPQIFFLTVHFCIRNSQMWQRKTLPLLAEMALAIRKLMPTAYKKKPAAWEMPIALGCHKHRRAVGLIRQGHGGRNGHWIVWLWRAVPTRLGWCDVPVCCAASSIADPLGQRSVYGFGHVIVTGQRHTCFFEAMPLTA